MLKELQKHLSNTFPFLKHQHLLVAVSGGVDSMVLAHLLHCLDYKIAIAHCNFSLRDKDSDLDEVFVENFSKQKEIPFHSIRFNTKEYCKTEKVSTQIGARTLRYDWFKKLSTTHGYTYILTAHHVNDVMETFFINLSRGTGIDGLASIPPMNHNIIRPLLIFSRQKIKEYAQQNDISWREDQSNAETKYLRNKIRHHIVPEFYNLHPQFEENFKKTIQHLHQSKNFIQQKINAIKQRVFCFKNNEIKIEKKLINALSDFEMYEIFKEYGFHTVSEIQKIATAQTGKEIYSENYCLLSNRSFLILYKKKELTPNSYLIKHKNDVQHLPIPLFFTTEQQELNKNTICIDIDKNPFPLILRKKEVGDIFSPTGMMGNKKVSKYYKDIKFSKLEKENTWILCNHQNKIIWIVGLRADKKNTVKNNTSSVIYIVKQ